MVSALVGQMAMGLADTLMVGRLGVEPLAAAACVNAVGHLPLALGFGLFSSVAVLTSRAFGSRSNREAGEAMRHGLILSILYGTLSAIALTFLSSRLNLLGQPESVSLLARPYCILFGLSILPAIFSHVIKQFGEALERPWAPTWIFLVGLLLNLFLNWILIFGNLGFDAMGLEGAGWATLYSRLFIAAGTLIDALGSKKLKAFLPTYWLRHWNYDIFKSLLKIGGPVGTQHLMEVGVFALAALMMGWISAEALAAHQIAITLAATTFMVPLGIGMATCVRIGHAWGAQKTRRIQRIGWVGIGMAMLAMACFSLNFCLFRFQIAGWFVDDPEVTDLTARLLLVAAIFQIADGTQVTAISALRGLADVRVPATIAAVAYWGLAAPMAWFFAFPLKMGATGVWIGLAMGLGAAAVTLAYRFAKKSSKEALHVCSKPSS